VEKALCQIVPSARPRAPSDTKKTFKAVEDLKKGEGRITKTLASGTEPDEASS